MNSIPQKKLRPATVLAAVAVFAIVVLVAVRGCSAPEEGEVETDVAVHVSAITRATLYRTVTAYGYVEPEPPGGGKPSAGALLSPIVGGVLAEIDCVEGQRVEQGSVLFRLDSRLAEVAVERARQDLDFAEKAFSRQQELLAENGTSQRAFQEAQQRLEAARSSLSAAETELAYLRIVSPLTGTVVRLQVEIGQYVDASTVLAEVIDLNRLVVSARVPGREVAGLEPGDTVQLGSDSAATGTVTTVGKDMDPRTGTYLARVSVPAGAPFRPGQFTDVHIIADRHEDVLVVPEVSLVTRAGEGSWIMVVTGDRAARRPVIAGFHDRGLVEVSGDGLAEGMTVVTDDAYSLPEETKIRIVGS